MPYVVAIALLDGAVTSRPFSVERLVDPTVVSLMRKVTVQERAEFSAQYPGSAYCRLRINTLSGDHIASEVRYPKGHINNRMDDRELEAKFRDMFGQLGNESQCEEALHALWNRTLTMLPILRITAAFCQPFLCKQFQTPGLTSIIHEHYENARHCVSLASRFVNNPG
ncbi:MAG: hypothetical protein A3G24_14035 [Betaproteobacteria bacterium RIFCSPLOWO2_12_FULL_62_13]|nr:MAG: hypothetical protein A3G24_14035 [Betaproteobacteria bacterium RIFCSPLOWO2_12_FULL_62_13]